MITGRERVLCVDDDGNILEAMRRTMGTTFTIVTALGGEDGLKKFDAEGPFAVVVSDLRMPVVDGISLFAHVNERSPATSRILLTGHADVQQAIRSINEGHIFRFLTKPCAGSLLRAAIQAGIEQYRLVTAEKVLQEQTLRGCIRSMAEILMLVHPIAGAQTSRVRRQVVELAEAMALPDLWRTEVAALLANVGFVTLPPATVEKMHSGKPLTPAEENHLARAPEAAAKLIANIPRMEEVQSALFYQRTHFDGTESPVAGVKGDRIPIAARILLAVSDFDLLVFHGMGEQQALDVLASRTGCYDPAVVQALRGLHAAPAAHARPAMVVVRNLAIGMVFDEDLRSFEGRVLVGRGAEVTSSMMERMREYWDEALLSRSVRMLVPPAADGQAKAAA
jgi:response regulator RpfG family c-di-GMP phosphodiesterase